MTYRVALVGAAQSRTALVGEVSRLVPLQLVDGEADLYICLGADRAALQTATQSGPTLALLGGGDIGAAVTLLLDGAGQAIVDESPLTVAEAINQALTATVADDDQTHVLTVEGALRDDALRQIDETLEAAGVRKRLRQRVQLVLDELLMNYALRRARRRRRAPAVRRGRSQRPRRRGRAAVRAALGLAWEKRFFVTVRDRFGSLEKATTLRYLAKCLQRPQPPLDDKPGGAGLGLYLIAHTADALYFRLHAGQQTEVTCAFDCAAHRPGLGLQAVGVREETLSLAARR